MISQAAARVRAGFPKNDESPDMPLEVERRSWEESAAQTPLPPGTLIEPFHADGVPCEWVRGSGASEDGVLLFLHGGGFNAGSCITHRDLAARLSSASGMPVLLVDYRLAPEHPYPAAVEDVIAVYHWLLNTGHSPHSIVFGGDSAGGGLVMQGLLALRQSDDPMPSAAVLISAMLDLSLSGDSMTSRAALDPLVNRPSLGKAINWYVGDRDPSDPAYSPVFADLRGLPPLLIQVGDHEILLSDSTRFAERARSAGVDVQLHIYPDLWHVFQSWGDLPESQEAVSQIGKFIKRLIMG